MLQGLQDIFFDAGDRHLHLLCDSAIGHTAAAVQEKRLFHLEGQFVYRDIDGGQFFPGGENLLGRGATGVQVALFAGIVPDAEISALASGLKSPLDYLVEPTAFEITSVRILPNQQIELKWNSNPGAIYTVNWSGDLTDFGADAGDDFQSEGETTTAVFDNPTITPQLPDGAPQLYLRVSENP